MLLNFSPRGTTYYLEALPHVAMGDMMFAKLIVKRKSEALYRWWS